MNKIFKIINGRAVSELAKSIGKAILISTFLFGVTSAYADISQEDMNYIKREIFMELDNGKGILNNNNSGDETNRISDRVNHSAIVGGLNNSIHSGSNGGTAGVIMGGESNSIMGPYDTTIIGSLNRASEAMRSVIIGSHSEANNIQDAVILGSYSVGISNTISVGGGRLDNGEINYNKIVNLHNGEISNASHDAINGSQLYNFAKGDFLNTVTIDADKWKDALNITEGTSGGSGEIIKADLKGSNEIEVTGEGKLLDANLTLSLKDGSISQSKLDKDTSDKIDSIDNKVNITELDNYAKIDASNLQPANVTQWQNKLEIGTGTIGGDKDSQSVTGETVINYLEDNYYSKGDIDKIIDNIDTGNGGNGVGKEYVDNSDKETLEKANDYTDHAKAEAVKEANAHSDANDIITLEKANEYTDEKFKGIDGEQIRTNTNNIERIEGIVKDNSYRINQNTQAIQENSKRIDLLDDKFSNAMASANALAGLSQSVIAGKSMLAVGLGGYDDKQALAVGYSVLSDNKKHVIRAGLSTNFSGKRKISSSISYGFHF